MVLSFHSETSVIQHRPQHSGNLGLLSERGDDPTHKAELKTPVTLSNSTRCLHQHQFGEGLMV